MSSNQVRDITVDMIDEQSIAQYLQHNPDFFERQPQLLARLRLQHPRNGATISLIERQVEALREKHQAQDEKLAEFVAVARANSAVAEKIHRLTRRLLRAADRRQVVGEIEAALREDFDARHALLVLPSALVRDGDEASAGLLRGLDAGDGAWRGFDSLFASGKPRCGQVRDTQREFLFGTEATGIGSVALVPLAFPDDAHGLLALGSLERDRFHPGMSTEFLARIGELITDALQRA
jgi:uncharacterized protein